MIILYKKTKMKTTINTKNEVDPDFRVSEYVLELFEKKYPKHFPKKRYLNYEQQYLDSKETFKDSLFQWVFEEDPWEKNKSKRTYY